jgi:hypothetical protein
MIFGNQPAKLVLQHEDAILDHALAGKYRQIWHFSSGFARARSKKR